MTPTDLDRLVEELTRYLDFLDSPDAWQSYDMATTRTTIIQAVPALLAAIHDLKARAENAEAIVQHASEEGPTYDELCDLSKVYNGACSHHNIDSYVHVNNWLKKQLAIANRVASAASESH